ncbi:PspC domain-containing protein [Amycolatopsis sp. PS_44_ISF1]|uniref:PspC domain-containing protein n=1 Tax=Amycolatopsis sp. PS_44_ISF1 TaxID=2974917 RepID=UPI0028DE743F|nr:PspC domain-containing protein [Amycolatopsis sp. PS_44_ISF1]MDT8911101.1 PspC domain-containing protein [Amycolatopsis sp. PS_44_ISF1]
MTNSVRPPNARKLFRSRTDRKLTGVCAGWADYLGVDPSMVRIAAVAGVVLSAGVVLPVYAAAAFLTPDSAETGTATATETEATTAA